MTRNIIISNRPRPSRPPGGPSGPFVSDEQRKAVFAAMARGGGGGRGFGGGGGGGGGSAGPEPSQRVTSEQAAAMPRQRIADRTNQFMGAQSGQIGMTPPEQPGRIRQTLEFLRQAREGWREGARAGVLNLADAFTFRQIDALGRAVESRSHLPGMRASQIAATTARESLLFAVTGLGLSYLRSAWLGTPMARTAIGQHAGLFSAIGGFGTQQAIEAYRASDPHRHYRSDNALAMASQLSGYIGGMGAFSSALRYGGAIMRALPASARITPDRLNTLKRSSFVSQLLERNPAARIPDMFATLSPQRLSAATQAQRALGATGEALHRTVSAVGRAVTPKPFRPAVRGMFDLAHATARFTGSTLREFARMPANVKKLRTASNAIRGSQAYAAEMTAQSQRLAAQATHHQRIASQYLERAANFHMPRVQSISLVDGVTRKAAFDNLARAHQASLQGHGGAQSLYRTARDQYFAQTRAMSTAQTEHLNALRQASQNIQQSRNIRDLIPQAQREASLALEQLPQHIQAQSEAVRGLTRGAFVTGGLVGTHAYHEGQIRQHQADATEHFLSGQNFPIPQDQPVGPVGMGARILTGVLLNNPGEKSIRAGTRAWHAEHGASRAVRDIADQQLADGTIDQSTWEDVVTGIRTPQIHSGGRSTWALAPAVSIMANWKINDALDRAMRTTNVRVGHVHDADTALFVDPRTGQPHSFPGQGPHQEVRGQPSDRSGWVRFHGFDAPELSEWGGHEATEQMRQLLPVGSRARVVEDSHARAQGLDMYGRQLGHIETPGVLGRIPYIGRAIPGRDVSEEIARQGWADVGVYRYLSGRTDNEAALHRAMESARANQLGIFSPEGQRHHPTAGRAPSPQERSDAYYQRMTGQTRPEQFWGQATGPAGVGFMAQGNLGVFRHAGRGGPVMGQSWNLLVSALAALEYNERARRSTPREYRLPRGIVTDYERSIREMTANIGQ